YGAIGQLSLVQPLLRGLDPEVAKEPLRTARRTSEAQRLALTQTRRRTVLAAYQAYLAAAEAERSTELADERLSRARKLTAFSRGRFEAGSLSRLDVLRGEQQEATAELARNAASNAADSATETLARTAGLPRGSRLTLAPPEVLP